MSFILDALKKLEQKRNLESVPDLLTVHSSPVQRPQKRLFWLFMIVIALLMNAGILLAWLKPWQSQKQVVLTESPSVPRELVSSEPVHHPDVTGPVPPPAVIEKTTGSSVTPPDRIKSSSVSAPDRDNVTQGSLTSKEDVDSIRTLSEEGTPDTTILSEESEPSGIRSFLPDEEELADLRGKIKEEIDFRTETPSDKSTISVHSVPGTAASHEEIIEMNQLPSDIRSELPKISVNTHIYSNDPSSRIVNINGIILREGEDVAKELTLDKITTSGVILRYKDYHFRIRAF